MIKLMSCLATGKPHGGNKQRRNCMACKAAYQRRYRFEGRNWDAAHYQRIKGTRMMSAKSKVYIAVRAGMLPQALVFSCVDCGSQAQVWDHRDYKKPLSVDPVCRRCNALRGSGLNAK